MTDTPADQAGWRRRLRAARTPAAVRPARRGDTLAVRWADRLDHNYDDALDAIQCLINRGMSAEHSLTSRRGDPEVSGPKRPWPGSRPPEHPAAADVGFVRSLHHDGRARPQSAWEEKAGVSTRTV